MRIDHKRGYYADSDGDGVLDPIEAALGSSSSSLDSDGDKLSDYFETYGIPDPTGINGVDDSIELPAMGASPAAQDIFIEIDRQPSHTIPSDLPSWMTETFANDSTYSGKTIYVHVDVDDYLPSYKYAGTAECMFPHVPAADWTYIGALIAAYQEPLRRGSFTYVAAGGTYYRFDEQDPQGPSCRLYSYDGIFEGGILLFKNPLPRGYLEHELGHEHSLCDPATGWSCRRLPKSVMNVDFVNVGFVAKDGKRRWSYSNGENTPFCQQGCTCGICGMGVPTDCDCDEWGEFTFNKRLCGDGNCEGYETTTCPSDCP